MATPLDFSYKPAPYANAIVLEPEPSSLRRITNQLLSPFSPLISLKSSFDSWRRSNGYEERPGALEDLTRPLKSGFFMRATLEKLLIFCRAQTFWLPTSCSMEPKPICKRPSRSTPSFKSRTLSAWAAPLRLRLKLAPITFQPFEAQIQSVLVETVLALG
jgi:hypothetical protein